MIDYTTFNNIKERMQDRFPALLEGYIKNSKTYLETIETSLNLGEINSVIEAAHSMKSASGLLGIIDVSKAAETLEYTGKALLDGSSNASLQPCYEALEESFSKIIDPLNNELAKVQDG